MTDTIMTTFSGFISGLLIVFWGYYLYDNKNFKIKWYYLLILIAYSALFYYSIENFSNLLHIGTVLICFLIIHQFLFHKSYSTICASTLIINLIRCTVILAEIVFGRFIDLSLLRNYHWFGSIFINTVTTIIFIIGHSKIKRIIKSYDIYYKKSWKSVIWLNFIIITILIFEISIEKYGSNIIILYPILCMIYLIASLYNFTYQKITLDTSLANYNEIYKFSYFMDNLINIYKTKLYDTRDELSLIKEQIPKNNKSIRKYINQLIEEKSHIEYSWLANLNNFNIPGVKGFLSYKIEEMMELNIEVELFISDTLKENNINLSDNELKNLCIIIGIFCDNAKEAAKNSINKTITIEAHKENNIIYLLIANTYDKVIPLKNIDDFGVTGHKKGCGTGLYMVHSIIESSHIFNKKTSIINDFFIQELTIDLTNK